MVITKGSSKDIEQSVKLEEFLEAPVKKGQKVGTLTFTLDGKEVESFDVLTTQSVEKMSFSAVMGELFKALIML
jgi:D-alanyl-D-alanine carboxypeptidase (penicillin-binding protein 5/6)